MADWLNIVSFQQTQTQRSDWQQGSRMHGVWQEAAGTSLRCRSLRSPPCSTEDSSCSAGCTWLWWARSGPPWDCSCDRHPAAPRRYWRTNHNTDWVCEHRHVVVIIPVSVSSSSLHHLFDDLFEVLVVGVVSGRSQDGVTVHLKRIRNCQRCTFIYSDSWRGFVDSGCHLHETRDVPEASQRAVRAQHVRRDDDATGELHTQHRRPCDHRVPAGRRRREEFTLSCGPLIVCSI